MSRFRANIFMQRGRGGRRLPHIPFKILTFAESACPNVVADMSRKPRGLILVPAHGSGKSTTRVHHRQDQHRRA
jgi:twitching motility protein PilT